ncbi:MAG: hypothetical protein JNN03_11070 [Rubrivivax sp.]|nr:hypothetical protein [Rubrivivax sp.]
MADVQRRRGRGWLPGLALAVVALMLCVICASAWLRLAQPQLRCAEWPACRTGAFGAAAASSRPATEPGGGPGVQGLVRGVHRAAATVTLVLVAGLVVLALRERPRRREVALPALALLGLALGLAALGIVTPGSRTAGVLLGNLVGGFAMLAVAGCLALRLRGVPALERSVARQARVLCGLWLAQAALGALSGAGLLRLAPQLHLVLAAVVLPWTLSLALQVLRAGRRGSGFALAGMCVAQALLGFVAAAQDAALAAVVLHNAAAALGIAQLLALAGAVAPGART